MNFDQKAGIPAFSWKFSCLHDSRNFSMIGKVKTEALTLGWSAYLSFLDWLVGQTPHTILSVVRICYSSITNKSVLTSQHFYILVPNFSPGWRATRWVKSLAQGLDTILLIAKTLDLHAWHCSSINLTHNTCWYSHWPHNTRLWLSGLNFTTKK